MILPRLKQQKNTIAIRSELLSLIERLNNGEQLKREEFLFILNNISQYEAYYLCQYATIKCKDYYNGFVYMRGLIEISNYCKQNCLYCGIRGKNSNAFRYRMSKEEILECVEIGDKLGFKTFVLQSGEDPKFTDEIICEILQEIKSKYPNCAITLSIGEKSKKSYKLYKEAGCDRYLLRHEAASERLYKQLHPASLKLENRLSCLQDIKEVGLQVGAGLMVGSPTQTNLDLVDDLMFLQDFQPHMCGIGPYISHSETPLRGNKDGNVEQTAVIVALTRLICPKTLIPSTTALATIGEFGQEKVLQSGANVLMPNLTYTKYRKKYALYENKMATEDNAMQSLNKLIMKAEKVGFKVCMQKGDHYDWVPKHSTKKIAHYEYV
jgi:biotin synthase